MKKLSVFRWNTWSVLAFLLLAVAALPRASAQDVTKSRILQNKTDEQDVRLHTAAVVTQIQGLIDELAANGISGDDLKVLNATKAALAHLSGPEMERVIASLQKAGETVGTKSGQQNVIDAYAGQKGIILQFRQILKDYEQRQAAYELPVRFKELAARQTDTMLTSVKVARDTAGKTAGELTSVQQATQQFVQADQEAISNEVNLAEEQLNKAAQGGTQDDAKIMQQAQQDMKSGALQKALGQANEDLKAGQLLKAINEQQIARDELRHIAQDLNPPANAVDALTDNAASLAKLIEEQKNLLVLTNAAVDVNPRVTGLDEKQGLIVDKTNSLQQDLQSTSPTAAAIVKDAINPMQLSRAALGGSGADNFTVAATRQQEAIAKLEDAQKQLQQSLADAQKAAADAAKDPVAKLKDLQQQIQAAMQQQQQLNNQTTQALNNTADSTPPNPAAAAQAQQQQSQLQQQTSTLQQTAQPLSLPASQALANATNQMNQAQQALGDTTNPPNSQQPQTPEQQAQSTQQADQIQQAQQAAQTALAQANQQVSQQIAQAQQQPPDPTALAAAANSLQQAQNSVSSAIAATTPQTNPPSAGTPSAGTPPDGSPPSMAAAAAALAAAAKDTQDAAQTPGLPDAAANAVKQAQASIAKGQKQAEKGNAPGTAQSAADAEQQLAQAQAAVAMAQAGLASASPPPPGADNGPPQPAMAAGKTPGKSTDGAKDISGKSNDKGPLHDVAGNGKFVTVASRDRIAIDQTAREKRPQEYAPMIDQYMKNLADQSSSPSP